MGEHRLITVRKQVNFNIAVIAVLEKLIELVTDKIVYEIHVS